MDEIDTSTAAIAALMDGVTAGPWEQDGPISAKIVWAGPDVRVCFMTSDGPASKNARFIAASRELVPALAAERDAAVLRAEQAERRESALLSSSEEARQFLRQRDAMKAENEALRSGAVCAAVKPLEWVEKWSDDWRGNIHQTVHPWYRRTIVPANTKEGGFHLLASRADPAIKYFREVSEAKSAVHVDYEIRAFPDITLRSESEVRNEGYALGFKAAIEAVLSLPKRAEPIGGQMHTYANRGEICMITPPADAQAALDAIEARVRAEVVEEAKKLAKYACLVPPDGGSPTEDEIAVCDEAVRRINALHTPASRAVAKGGAK